jgi:hypothetical protein
LYATDFVIIFAFWFFFARSRTEQCTGQIGSIVFRAVEYFPSGEDLPAYRQALLTNDGSVIRQERKVF